MLNSLFKRTLFLTSLVGALSAFAAPAKAVLTLTLSDGNPSDNQTVTASTMSPTQAVYSGSYEGFTYDFDLAFSNNSLGSGNQPAVLQTNALNVTSPVGSGLQTISLIVSDTGFNFPGTSGSLLSLTSSLSGTFTPLVNGESVSFQGTATSQPDDTAYSTSPQTYVANTASSSNSSFNLPDASTTFTRETSYDLQSVLTLSLEPGANFVQSTGAASVTLAPTGVPEPASASLVLVSAATMLCSRRRRAR